MAGIAALGELSARRAPAAAWELSLASPDDDADLRALLRRAVIPGAVRVAFTREPQYAAGEGVAGARDVTVLARRAGEVVGMGRCTVRTLHRNGALRRIGYLGELRIAPGTSAAARLLRDGYGRLTAAVADTGVEGFITSIATDNVRARRVLEFGPRMGLPEYRPLASLVTLVAPVRRRTPRVADDAAAAGDPADATQFVRDHAREAQLTLPWDDAQWPALHAHDVAPHDMCVARRDGRIVAAAAVWDQRPFRQTVIDGYAGALQLTRPLLNVIQRLRGLPPLPHPGHILAQGALLGVTVPHARDWPSLWRALQQRAAVQGLSWLTLTRDASDPQLSALRTLLRARAYHTVLYEVVWHDRPSWPDRWDGRRFAPEVGLL